MVKVTKNKKLLIVDSINTLILSKAFGLIQNSGIFKQFSTKLVTKVSEVSDQN